MLDNWFFLINLLVSCCCFFLHGMGQPFKMHKGSGSKLVKSKGSKGTGSKYSYPYYYSNSREARKLRNTTDEERLIKDLFMDYDPDARAVPLNSHVVTVEIQYTLIRIQKLDERSQVLTTTGLVITEWMDKRLAWEPNDYGNLTDIVVHPGRIWLPELTLMNGAEDMVQDFEKIRVLISHIGKLHWEPGGIFSTTCDIDISFFPFDTQRCPIKIGAWAYYSQRMNLTNSSSIVPMHDFRMNGEWQVVSTGVAWGETVLPCCKSIGYSYVEFALELRRRTIFYIVNIILPCLMLSILVLVVFCIPPSAGEKISAGISVLLAFTIFLLMVAETVPRTSLYVPIIVVYLTFTMTVGTLSVCLTVLVLNIHHLHPEKPVPGWIRIFVLQVMAKFVCFRSPIIRKSVNSIKAISDPDLTTVPNKHNGPARRLANHLLSDGETPSSASDRLLRALSLEKMDRTEENDWKNVARVVDRFLFWLVFTVMIVSAICILLAPYYLPVFVEQSR